MSVTPSQLGQYPANYATVWAFRLSDSSIPGHGCGLMTERVILFVLSKLRVQKHSEHQPVGKDISVVHHLP